MKRIRGDQYTGILKVGQRVYTDLYGRGEGIIFQINGEQKPSSVRSLCGVIATGGNAEFWIVFKCGKVTNKLPECIFRGVQWEVLEDTDIATTEEISAALVHAGNMQIEREKKEQEATDKRSARFAALPSEYPYLLKCSDAKDKSSSRIAAMNIRTELKRAFRGFKFSVRSDHNSIDVNWTDGPSRKEVTDITSKYQEGHFNGMEDIYEHNSENVFPDVFGGAKYVSEHREISPALKLMAANRLGYNITEDKLNNNNTITGLDARDLDRVWREAMDISLFKTSESQKHQKTTTPKNTDSGSNKADDILAKMGISLS